MRTTFLKPTVLDLFFWLFFSSVNLSCEVGRPKIKNQGDYVLVGHELLNASRARLNVRTPFDGELLSDVKSTVP